MPGLQWANNKWSSYLCEGLDHAVRVLQSAFVSANEATVMLPRTDLGASVIIQTVS